MASKTDIFNRALIKIGVGTVTSPDDNTEQARKCRQVYDTLVRSELRKNPWSFALERASLAALSVAPAFGWSYAYQKPADFIRLVQINDYYDFAQIRTATDAIQVPYALEGDHILTDYTAPLSLRYVKDMSEDTEKWDDLFVEAFACALAKEICYSLTKSQGLLNAMTQLYKMAMADAKRMNAIELPPVPIADNSWITTRL